MPMPPNDTNNIEKSSEPPPLDPIVRKFEDNELAWDNKVAYYHPSIDNLIILALADMSHAVKKIANAVERGNLRGIDGMAICIHISRIYIWQVLTWLQWVSVLIFEIRHPL